MGVEDQIPCLLVHQKDLTRVFANDLQRGLERASQDLVQVLGAIHLGGDAGQGGEFGGARTIRQRIAPLQTPSSEDLPHLQAGMLPSTGVGFSIAWSEAEGKAPGDEKGASFRALQHQSVMVLMMAWAMLAAGNDGCQPCCSLGAVVVQ